jgi:hypothetical protein
MHNNHYIPNDVDINNSKLVEDHLKNILSISQFIEKSIDDTSVSIGIEKSICPLFEYNCLCLQVNPIVGHLNFVLSDWKREVNHSLIEKNSIEKTSTHLGLYA